MHSSISLSSGTLNDFVQKTPLNSDTTRIKSIEGESSLTFQTWLSMLDNPTPSYF